MKILLLCHLRKIMRSLSQFGDTNIIPAALQWIQIFNRLSGKDPMHNRYGPPSEHPQWCFSGIHLLCVAQLWNLHNVFHPGLALLFPLFSPRCVWAWMWDNSLQADAPFKSRWVCKIPPWRQKWVVSRLRGSIIQKTQSTKVWPLSPQKAKLNQNETKIFLACGGFSLGVASCAHLSWCTTNCCFCGQAALITRDLLLKTWAFQNFRFVILVVL